MSSSAARTVRTTPAPRPARPVPPRPPLRAVPAGRPRPARAPFVALVVTLLTLGLLGLLLLNTALAEGAFRVQDLEGRNAELAQQEQQLEQEIARLGTPQVLSERARDLGMVPSGPPAFLDPATGEVAGRTTTAERAPEASGAAAGPASTGARTGETP
jgi:cell division protein FtsB